ncbi:mucin-5AC-like [Hyperolius riggenbachi]|uniref:mucin-5AC-like n=1 Tax=Hyperolius riggenbachi TaxID=752182 RepID=UPI0035A35134
MARSLAWSGEEDDVRRTTELLPIGRQYPPSTGRSNNRSKRQSGTKLDVSTHLGLVAEVLPAAVSTPSPCTPSCQWTQWFNVYHPSNQPDDGDFETLSNIRAQGYKICVSPKNITCRSVRFPYIPYKELDYTTKCDPSIGLTCCNKDNSETCIDFEVQLLCCDCEEETRSSPLSTTLLPAVTTEKPVPQCENPLCSWTQWFNVYHPSEDISDGDFENITAIRKMGFSVCDVPQEISCRLGRFPYMKLEDLDYIQECSTSHGLVCFNENQPNGLCLDYEVQFLCCACDTSTPTTEVSTTETDGSGTGENYI